VVTSPPLGLTLFGRGSHMIPALAIFIFQVFHG
jgi:hypothetical protein